MTRGSQLQQGCHFFRRQAFGQHLLSQPAADAELLHDGLHQGVVVPGLYFDAAHQLLMQMGQGGFRHRFGIIQARLIHGVEIGAQRRRLPPPPALRQAHHMHPHPDAAAIQGAQQALLIQRRSFRSGDKNILLIPGQLPLNTAGKDGLHGGVHIPGPFQAGQQLLPRPVAAMPGQQSVIPGIHQFDAGIDIQGEAKLFRLRSKEVQQRDRRQDEDCGGGRQRQPAAAGREDDPVPHPFAPGRPAPAQDKVAPVGEHAVAVSLDIANYSRPHPSSLPSPKYVAKKGKSSARSATSSKARK